MSTLPRPGIIESAKQDENTLPTGGILSIAAVDMEKSFLGHRHALLAFLRRVGAGHAAEDILHELWMKLPREGTSIQEPKSYLYRMAHTCFIDWHRSQRQAQKRDAVWNELTGPAIEGRNEQPDADRILEARQVASQAMAVINEQGERVARVFTRHRLDGMTQREVAAELGVSVSTVEGDLRRAYQALAFMRQSFDKA